MDYPTPTTYQEFLTSKLRDYSGAGFDVSVDTINPMLFPFQRDIVQWALRKGRCAIFAECGLGKTPMQLEWSRHVCSHTCRDVLILTPLVVAQQTIREGAKFGIPVTLCREGSDVRPGINVTNYERLHLFDVSRFVGVVLDESSILKSYMGKTKRALIDLFGCTPYRLCCTATPAPNDHMEIGNHSEFLGVMPSPEMLSRWFINDTMSMGTYRLKGHAVDSFWEWVASWAVSLRLPSDLGYDDDGFILPPLNIRQTTVAVNLLENAGEHLFRIPELNATGIHREMRLTAGDRAAAVAEQVNASRETWIVWCNTNYEADELTKRIPDAVEIRGNHTADQKERAILAFLDGQTRVLVSKPTITGFGLNFQHCHNVAFVGLSYSFEQFYQSLRRVYRFGQTEPVNAVIVAAETEGHIVDVVWQKVREHEALMAGMRAASSKLSIGRGLETVLSTDRETQQGRAWTMYLGDCVDVVRELPDASIQFSIFSPPFSGLYIYSDALQDMGNVDDDAQFFEHFGFLVPELHRVTQPGRLCAVHCKQLVNYKGRDGMAGLRDFRGDLIRAFTAHGWAYHSEVCIWKDPVIEMQRTKAHGLLYKQLRADSTFSRQGLAEYLLLFRRWAADESESETVIPVTHTHASFELDMWQRYASPVWFDIRQTRVLNVQIARDDQDEKHIAPLQLDVIERALALWTNPGDLVLSPFAGIGSEGYVSLQEGRRFVGAELKRTYFERACANLRQVEFLAGQPTLFDMAPLRVIHDGGTPVAEGRFGEMIAHE